MFRISNFFIVSNFINTTNTSMTTNSTESKTPAADCVLYSTGSDCLRSAADYEQSENTLRTLALPLDQSVLDTSSDASFSDGMSGQRILNFLFIRTIV